MAEARKALAQKGGQANLKKHGKAFYKAISKKGVEARKNKCGISKGYDVCDIENCDHGNRLITTQN